MTRLGKPISGLELSGPVKAFSECRVELGRTHLKPPLVVGISPTRVARAFLGKVGVAPPGSPGAADVRWMPAYTEASFLSSDVFIHPTGHWNGMVCPNDNVTELWMA
jgi:hypothetical protein